MLCTIGEKSSKQIKMDYLDSRVKTISEFKESYKQELMDLENEINLINEFYLLLFSKKPEYCFQEKSEFLILILRSVDYLISAISLVEQRAMFEAGNIVRLCIETSSIAIHINSDSEIFKKYKQNKYKSTSAINYAKKHIEITGELWGSLSEIFVHPNTFHGIVSQQIDNKITIIPISVEENDYKFHIVKPLTREKLLKILEKLNGG